jgi:transposase
LADVVASLFGMSAAAVRLCVAPDGVREPRPAGRPPRLIDDAVAQPLLRTEFARLRAAGERVTLAKVQAILQELWVTTPSKPKHPEKGYGAGEDKEYWYADYHDNMGQDIFLEWLGQLCKKLKSSYGKCVIKMDGASYHKTRIDPPPTSSSKKDQVREWMTRNGLPFEPTETCAVLRARIQAANIKTKLHSVELAREYGHTVIFTPPYHPELQEIEIVWGALKAAVYARGKHSSQALRIAVAEESLDMRQEAFGGAHRKVVDFEEEYKRTMDEGEFEGPIEDPGSESDADSE